MPVGWIPFVCCTQPGVVKRQQANVWAHCAAIVVQGPIILEMTCYYHHAFDNYIKLWRKETVCVCNLADILNDIGFMLQTLQTVQLYRQHHVSFKLWSAIWLIDSLTRLKHWTTFHRWFQWFVERNCFEQRKFPTWVLTEVWIILNKVWIMLNKVWITLNNFLYL